MSRDFNTLYEDVKEKRIKIYFEYSQAPVVYLEDGTPVHMSPAQHDKLRQLHTELYWKED